MGAGAPRSASVAGATMSTLVGSVDAAHLICTPVEASGELNVVTEQSLTLAVPEASRSTRLSSQANFLGSAVISRNTASPAAPQATLGGCQPNLEQFTASSPSAKLSTA